MKLRENSMFLLYIISGILAYAHKIPFLGRIISLLSIWYGRTTWWKILIKIRKLFIIFNALIGVLMVYKTVGFGYDNILAGFAGMGYTYIEMFTNMTKKLFNWFVELFDQKIIPNVPKDAPSKPHFWSPRGLDYSWNNKLPKLDSIPSEWVTNPFNLNVNTYTTPWYKEWSTWLWIAGIVTAGYLGYKFIIDPLFIDSFKNPTVNVNSPGGTTIDPSGNDITLGRRFNDVAKSIGFTISKIRYNLNPINWLLATSTQDINNQFQSFIERQNDMVTADRRYYPFTENNPFLPWYSKIKIHFLGESMSESLQRFKDREIAERIYSSLQVSKGKFTSVEGLSPNLWAGGVASVGLGVNTPITSFNYADAIHAINVENKFNTLSPTPKAIPILPEFEGGNSSWKVHEKDLTISAEKFMHEWKSNTASSSKTMLEDIPAHFNKYSVLEVE